jgi:hypothetical protein
MPTAPDDIQDPRYWLDQAEKFRVWAKQMNDERAREAFLSVAEAYDRFALSAAKGPIYELAVSRVIDERKASCCSDAIMSADVRQVRT